jgi:hypothetical protein
VKKQIVNIKFESTKCGPVSFSCKMSVHNLGTVNVFTTFFVDFSSPICGLFASKHWISMFFFNPQIVDQSTDWGPVHKTLETRGLHFYLNLFSQPHQNLKNPSSNLREITNFKSFLQHLFIVNTILSITFNEQSNLQKPKSFRSLSKPAVNFSKLLIIKFIKPFPIEIQPSKEFLCFEKPKLNEAYEHFSQAPRQFHEGFETNVFIELN